MKRVTGIGGIFFRCKDVEKTKAWYQKHLGFDTDAYGCTFWQKNDDTDSDKSQQWSPFDQGTTYFGSSEQEFMVNYRVFDLKKLLSQLKEEQVEILGEIEEFDYGDFAWIKDCDGRKVELWQPKNEELFKNQ